MKKLPPLFLLLFSILCAAFVAAIIGYLVLALIFSSRSGVEEVMVLLLLPFFFLLFVYNFKVVKNLSWKKVRILDSRKEALLILSNFLLFLLAIVFLFRFPGFGGGYVRYCEVGREFFNIENLFNITITLPIYALGCIYFLINEHLMRQSKKWRSFIVVFIFILYGLMGGVSLYKVYKYPNECTQLRGVPS